MKGYKVVQSNTRNEGRRHVRRPQDQLRQVKIASSNRETAIRTIGNNQRHSDGSTKTAPQPSNVGFPSNLRREFGVRKANAEPNQKPNRRTNVRPNPKVQQQANGYSRPQVPWNPRPNTQSAVKNPLTPAKAPALYGQKAASQSGLGVWGWPSNTVKATRLSNRRASKVSRPGQTTRFGTKKHQTGSTFNQPYARRQGAAQSRPRGVLEVQRFDDPLDPRYQQTTNYMMRRGYGSVTIRRLKPQTKRQPQHSYAVLKRRDPPKRQSQRVWQQRTSS